MKNDFVCYVAAALTCAACILTPARTYAAKNHNISVDFQGKAEHCSDLKVRSNGEFVQANQAFTLQRSEAPTLELSGDRGVVSVWGWDRAEYSVEACKIAAADTRSTAEQALQGINVSRNGARFSSSGPSAGDSEWQVYFLVHAPKSANLDLETRNGPISVSQVTGNLKVHSTNGPVSVNESTGVMEIQTTNGPISFRGGGGEVRLNATNGPISLSLAGDVWNGSHLQAHTHNGPVNLSIPDTFRSGVRLETSGNSPINCRASGCPSAWSDVTPNQRVLQLNGSQDTILVITENGPVNINGGSKSRKII